MASNGLGRASDQCGIARTMPAISQLVAVRFARESACKGMADVWIFTYTVLPSGRHSYQNIKGLQSCNPLMALKTPQTA
ncbi:hypothetical protein DD235_11870 [Corticimicrobacter populi]|uniref:Uncharacterized protein n=1 Tax=Corticimicrobacter populi TaxID=2175229 RepID=A0A2V1K1S2_9BURK|nr:hypothetical protein DD235_11870 [Corticimicrobacter populi]